MTLITGDKAWRVDLNPISPVGTVIEIEGIKYVAHHAERNQWGKSYFVVEWRGGAKGGTFTEMPVAVGFEANAKPFGFFGYWSAKREEIARLARAEARDAYVLAKALVKEYEDG